jgi:hypothetical protein
MGYRALDPIATQKSLRVDSTPGTPSVGSRPTSAMIRQWDEVLAQANSGASPETSMMAAFQSQLSKSLQSRRSFTTANRGSRSYLGNRGHHGTNRKSMQPGRRSADFESAAELDTLFAGGDDFASWLRRAA